MAGILRKRVKMGGKGKGKGVAGRGKYEDDELLRGLAPDVAAYVAANPRLYKFAREKMEEAKERDRAKAREVLGLKPE